MKTHPMRSVVHSLVMSSVVWITTSEAESIRGEDFVIHSFERRQLTDVYYSEGIAAGDLNRDGHVDIVWTVLVRWAELSGEARDLFGQTPADGTLCRSFLRLGTRLQ